MQEDPDMEILEAVERGFAAEEGTVKQDVRLRRVVETQLRAWIKVCLPLPSKSVW